MDAQLKRGLIEICVLVALKQQDSYGYQIIKDVTPYAELSESTLYPILKRLEGAGCIQSYSREHNGRLRKYYAITQEGDSQLRQFRASWGELSAAVNLLFREEEPCNGQENR